MLSLKGEEIFITTRPGPEVWGLTTKEIVVTPHKPLAEKPNAPPFCISFPVFDLSAGKNDPDDLVTYTNYVKEYFQEVIYQMRQWVWRCGGRETTYYESRDGMEVGWKFTTPATSFFPNQWFKIFERGGVVDLVNDKGSIVKMWSLDQFIKLECSSWAVGKNYQLTDDHDKDELTLTFVAYEEYLRGWSTSFATGLLKGLCELGTMNDLPQTTLNLVQVNQLLRLGKISQAIYGPMRPPGDTLPAGKEVHYTHHLSIYLSPNRNDAGWGNLGLSVNEDNWYCVVYKNDFPAHHKYIQAKQLDYLHERGVYL